MTEALTTFEAEVEIGDKTYTMSAEIGVRSDGILFRGETIVEIDDYEFTDQDGNRVEYLPLRRELKRLLNLWVERDREKLIQRAS